MVGEACLPSNAYYPRTPDYTLYSGVHVCWSEQYDSSVVYEFMSLDYGLGTMTATTILCKSCVLLAVMRLLKKFKNSRTVLRITVYRNFLRKK